MRRSLLLLLFTTLLVSGPALAQSTYDFGSAADGDFDPTTGDSHYSITSGGTASGNTTCCPAPFTPATDGDLVPPAGTATFVNGFGTANAANAGGAAGDLVGVSTDVVDGMTGSHLYLTGQQTSKQNKFQIHLLSGTTIFAVRYNVRFSDNINSANANGFINTGFFVGSGGDAFRTNEEVPAASSLFSATCFLWLSGSAITVRNSDEGDCSEDSAGGTIGSALAFNTTYDVEMYFNNASSGSQVYTGPDDIEYTLESNTYDMFVDDVLFAQNVSPDGSLAAGTNLTGFGLMSRTSNGGNMTTRADDFVFNTTTDLPVELARFDGVTEGQDVTLRWATASERNNAGFEVQQFVDGRFESLGFVAGAGTTLEQQSYTHRVEGLAPGRHRFRLKQIDFDGASAVSQQIEVAVAVPNAFFLSDAYPNPFNPQTRFTLAVQRSQNVDVAVYNALGQRVRDLYAGTMEAQSSKTLSFEAGDLPSGLYWIRAVGESFETAQPVTLLK